jgi:DNA-binding LytR/AlgR family response regulator
MEIRSFALRYNFFFKGVDLELAYFKGFEKEQKLEKTLEKLKKGDFSEVKKLSNSDYFRIKVNDKARIIFTFRRDIHFSSRTSSKSRI